MPDIIITVRFCRRIIMSKEWKMYNPSVPLLLNFIDFVKILLYSVMLHFCVYYVNRNLRMKNKINKNVS